MTARKYTRRVSIYQTTKAADGYGGYTMTETLVGSSWAEIISNSTNSSKLNELGVSDPINTITVRLRKRNDLTYTTGQYILYNSSKYVIKHITDIDLHGVDIEMVCIKQNPSVVTMASPTFGATFDLTFN